LGVRASDLRGLLWSNSQLQDEVFGVVEARLDNAEKNIAEALNSDDNRRRDAASFSCCATAIALAVAAGSRQARARPN
jgi:hypothetical protein